MKTRSYLPTCTALMFSLFTLCACASNTRLEPSSEHAEGLLEIIKVLDKRHYRSIELNDEFSRQLLARYLNLLDPGKSYFLRSDITDFERWSTSLDDELQDGDLDHVFVIYNRIRSRITERMEANIALLESDQGFDFDIEETLSLDPELREWFADENEADNFWRKRTKDALLRLLLSEKEAEAARELLIKRYKNQLSLISQQSADDSFEVYANAVVGIYDPHTS